ncbi:MAG: DNA polymerase IV [Thermicanus sp.]|nr:DNA polymerase IV [Thermicanus sp.]
MAARVIFLADMESFFASVEVAAEPALRGRPVVVAGDPERRHGIILAATPQAKACGVKTAMPLWEARQHCPELIVVRPHMSRYIDVSLQITEIFESFTDRVEPYSIDEQFLDVTDTLHLFGGNPLRMAKKIQEEIWEKTGVRARIGIGPNKMLAKICCDNKAKKSESGIHQWTEENFRREMWPLPIESLFGVGGRMRRHLRNMGIRTIGQLAQIPVERLKKRWGVNGEILWRSANGIDPSPVMPQTLNGRKGVGHSMTLPRDYREQREIEIILLELTEEVCRRLRRLKLRGRTISVSVRGADFDRPTGFHRSYTLTDASNITMEVYQAVIHLFRKHWDGEPVRSVGMGVTNLEEDDQYQLNLFRDRMKERKLGYCMDSIREKYGPTSLLRAASLTASGQVHERATKIGGHEA